MSSSIRPKSHEGWRLVRTRAARPVDVIVVYKVDRLTRSLADFAKLVELFDQHSVSFVSVTQSFNTTSSMGRLTLNVLLSFAQFEREVIGERVRDKIAASKRKGLWVGGPIPLGYATVKKKLIVVPEEARRSAPCSDFISNAARLEHSPRNSLAGTSCRRSVPLRAVASRVAVRTQGDEARLTQFLA